MQLYFNLNYRAQFGQRLQLRVLSPLGLTLPLQCTAPSSWEGNWRLDPAADVQLTADGAELTYIYELLAGDGRIIRQENVRFAHRLKLQAGLQELCAVDHWSAEPERSYLFTKVFAPQEHSFQW